MTAKITSAAVLIAISLAGLGQASVVYDDFTGNLSDKWTVSDASVISASAGVLHLSVVEFWAQKTMVSTQGFDLSAASATRPFEFSIGLTGRTADVYPGENYFNFGLATSSGQMTYGFSWAFTANGDSYQLYDGTNWDGKWYQTPLFSNGDTFGVQISDTAITLLKNGVVFHNTNNDVKSAPLDYSGDVTDMRLFMGFSGPGPNVGGSLALNNATVTAVPEPATLLLVVMAGGVMAITRRKRVV